MNCHRRVLACMGFALLGGMPCLVTVGATPPRMLLQEASTSDAGAAGGTRTSFSIVRLPNGDFAYYDRNRPADGPMRLADRSGQKYTFLPYLPPEILNSKAIESGSLANGQILLTTDHHIVSVSVKAEQLDPESAARVGLPRYLNVWCQRANATETFPPEMIWRGYNGSQMEYQQLSTGRILVPFGSFQPHAKAEPPTGRHKTIIQLSDDYGRSWRESASQLSSPCYAAFNGSNEGACEPAIEELRDGRVWMLMRTQAGFLYESYSNDHGLTWSSATASRFNTSTGPPNILRHRNGWLVVCWNNCEMPPRQDGQGVYGGRDALHIAVSTDDGRTWRGFREIYLDHRRNDNPAKTGDRGTAYPLGSYTADGMIVVLAGQGEGGRNPILIDPDWIIQTKAREDFSDGLASWSVYKHHGPASRWWRARSVGCDLVPHPAAPTRKCLHIRKPDELPADGATWNFPNGWVGSLTARVMLSPEHLGGTICLNDRMFDPANDFGEEFSVFRADFARDGRIGTKRLRPNEWYDLKLEWDLSIPECRLMVNQEFAGLLPLRHPTLNGISYVRFRSKAEQLDHAGFLLAEVNVQISDPFAPACSEEDRHKHERRYIRNVVSQWK